MSEPLRLHEQGRSRAVVMGTWDYRYLRPVPAARFSLDRMFRLLTGPACGWVPSDVTPLANESGPGDLADVLMTSFEDVPDVALFYFVGHGQLNTNDELCLGLGRSRPELNRRSSTSLEYKAVREALRNSPALVKIVILDCCYSGKAVDPANSLGTDVSPALRVLDGATGAGAYVMTASSPYQEAWCEVGEGQPQTYFTKYLADTVERGVPHRPSHLTLGLLFNAVRDRLAADHLPVPERRSVNDPEGYVFARNMAPAETQKDPQETIRQLTAELAAMRAATPAPSPADSAEADAVERALRGRRADITDLRAATAPPPAATPAPPAADLPAAVTEPTVTLPDAASTPPTAGTPTGSTDAAVVATSERVQPASTARRTQPAAPPLPLPTVQVVSVRGGITAELGRLRELAGTPSTLEISRLARRTGDALSEEAVHEILTGRRAPSIDETLAISRACGIYAEETGRRLRPSEYDREAWRTRHERLVGQGDPAHESGSPGIPEPQLIIPTEMPDGRQPTATLLAPIPEPAPPAEEVREARRLEAAGRAAEAERLLRREARRGSIAAMEERIALYRRQGRAGDAERALHEAAEAGSSSAAETLDRLRQRLRGDERRA
ncbi:caspase family protein [Micromonospora sp. NPDC047187]|uniref:caspase, EACC1-associated type n=1 Tax=Micromonospora sp. NPDC047187 TaxID=3155262 RepID=UPI0033C1A00C